MKHDNVMKNIRWEGIKLRAIFFEEQEFLFGQEKASRVGKCLARGREDVLVPV